MLIISKHTSFPLFSKLCWFPWRNSNSSRASQCSSTFISKKYCWKISFMYLFTRVHTSLDDVYIKIEVWLPSLSVVLNIQHLFTLYTFSTPFFIYFLVYHIFNFNQISFCAIPKTRFLFIDFTKIFSFLFCLFCDIISQFPSSCSYNSINLQNPSWRYIFLTTCRSFYVSEIINIKTRYIYDYYMYLFTIW